MPELETIEIRSGKNPEEKWIINLQDYDPGVHTRWDEPLPSASSAQPEPAPSEQSPHSDAETATEAEEGEVAPSVDDFFQDDDGNEFVNIINPENRRARLQIPVDEFNPDEHDLWSSHPRFQR